MAGSGWGWGGGRNAPCSTLRVGWLRMLPRSATTRGTSTTAFLPFVETIDAHEYSHLSYFIRFSLIKFSLMSIPFHIHLFLTVICPTTLHFWIVRCEMWHCDRAKCSFGCAHEGALLICEGEKKEK